MNLFEDAITSGCAAVFADIAYLAALPADKRKIAKVNDDFAVEWKNTLAILMDALAHTLNVEPELKKECSIGKGSIGDVWWIRFYALGQTASKGVYVSACFDYKGRGVVAGLSRSAENLPGIDLPIAVRDLTSHEALNVVQFNKTFYNPREFFRDTFSAAEFIQHLQESLTKYKRLLAGEDIEMSTEPPARVYIARLINPGSVAAVKALHTFTHDGLSIFEKEIQKDDPIFIYFGGDGPKDWIPGLSAVGKVTKPAYDKGYDAAHPNHFKIDVLPLHALPQTIPTKTSKIHPKYADPLYDVPYVGAKHPVTQAIQKIDPGEGLRAISALYLDEDPTARPVLQQLGLLLDPPAQPNIVSASKGTYSANPPPAAVTLTAQEERIKALMLTYKQVILYGPPGTGKTYHARRIAQTLDTHDLAVFHPSYGYEDFVGSIRPRLVSSDPGSPAPPALQVEEFIGIFQRLCRRAQAQPAQKHLLILDEINRGDIARIFGELIYAIEADKRGSTVALPYLQDGTLTVPANLYLIGTMNSSDRSITQLDVALRRRFAFFEVEPASGLLAQAMIGPISLQALLDRLNDLLLQYRDRDHRIGQAYLMTPDPGNSQPLSTAAELSNAWYYRLLPLLAEYFYSDPARLAAFLGPAFIRTRPGTAGDYGSQPVYETRSYADDTAFLAALQQFVTGGPPAPAGTPVPAPLPLTQDESDIDEELGIDSEAAI